MPRHFRRKGQRKPPVKHSGTFLDNIGQGSNAISQVILKTDAGPRSTDGTPISTKDRSNTAEICFVADSCKYINLGIQVGPRAENGNPVDRTGWLEWAMVLVRENETAVPATNLGTQTLGDICTNMYRAECIYTGVIPMGETQPATAVIKLKIPSKKVSIKIGDEWRFITFFRSVNAASTNQNAVRLLKTFNYLVRS